MLCRRETEAFWHGDSMPIIVADHGMLRQDLMATAVDKVYSGKAGAEPRRGGTLFG